jgi:hypothetical protein
LLSLRTHVHEVKTLTDDAPCAIDGGRGGYPVGLQGFKERSLFPELLSIQGVDFCILRFFCADDVIGR